MSILIIEDDPTLSRNISDALKAEGFATECVLDGKLAERRLRKADYECVVMDINLPGKSGFDLCRDFRTHNQHTPVLMLTAFGELEDKVKGYNCGADDYLTKPFYIRELILRVQSLIKRTAMTDESKDSSTITAGDIVIKDSEKRVMKQGKEIPLTPREYQILLKLCKNPGEVVSKSQLIKEIWGTSFDTNTNTIEVYINFLRNKIDKPFGTTDIKTKVGYGYYIDAE